MSLILRITKQVAEFVKVAESFTILDLSEAIKNDGGGWVSHSDVRDEARPFLDYAIQYGLISDYLHTDIRVYTRKGPTYSRLYHHEYFDPEHYRNRAKIASCPTDEDDNDDDDITEEDDDDILDSLFNPVVKSTPAKNKSPCELVCVRQYDSRLEIPKKFLESSGLYNEDVSIINHPNSITIKKDPNGEYCANKGWRLSKSVLNNSNLLGNQILEIRTFTDKIVLSKSKVDKQLLTNFFRIVTNETGNKKITLTTRLDTIDVNKISNILNNLESFFDITFDDEIDVKDFTVLDLVNLVSDSL